MEQNTTAYQTIRDLKRSVKEFDDWTVSHRKEIENFERQKEQTLKKIGDSLLDNTKILNEIENSQNELKDCYDCIGQTQFKLRLKLDKLYKIQEDLNLNSDQYKTPSKSTGDRELEHFNSLSDQNGCSLIELQIKTMKTKISMFINRISKSMNKSEKTSPEIVLKSMQNTMDDSIKKLILKNKRLDETISNLNEKQSILRGKIDQFGADKFTSSQGTSFESIAIAAVFIVFLFLFIIQL